MTPFDKALAHTLGIEGGFSDNPNDSGGVTQFGITEQVARAFGYQRPMNALPSDLAKRIYKENYWDLLRLDSIAEQSEPVALELFDTCVNTGLGFAGRSLQRLLNAFNRQQADYSDITVDGLLGRATLAALAAFLGKRGKVGEDVLVEALNSLQGTFYVELVERRPKDEEFFFGWLLNRVMRRAR
jgi:lysozyme family protein